MTTDTSFFPDPSALPGPAGQWLRGEGPLPDGAIWIPLPDRTPRDRRMAVAAGVCAAGLGLGALVASAPWTQGLTLAALAVFSVAWHRWPSQLPPLADSGRHGLVLEPHRLTYRRGPDCAVVPRADVTGVERRKHPVLGVVAAFQLAGRTGRGALVSPAPGPEALALMNAWWQAGPPPDGAD